MADDSPQPARTLNIFLLRTFYYWAVCHGVCHVVNVSGVRVKRTSGDVCLTAKRVVSTAGAINTFDQLLPPSVASKSCQFSTCNMLPESFGFISLSFMSIRLKCWFLP